MIRRLVSGAAMLCAACSDLGTDPNAVVALSYRGLPYPSIVVGDSLRDSSGAVLQLRATGLNYKGEAVDNAQILFASPDTVLRLFDDGNVFALARKPDGTAARIFATIGSLQSPPDTLPIVPRADSIVANKLVDTIPIATEGGVTAAALGFRLLGDTLAGSPKAPVRSWLVSFQLQYHGTLLSPTDTSVAYTFVAGGNRRIPTFVDTTDGSGGAERRVFVRSISTDVTEDTIFLIATARVRKTAADPLVTQSTIVIRRP